MKLIFLAIILTATSIGFSQNKGSMRLKKGRWLAQLQLNKTDQLPFVLEVGKKNSFSVINGTETIVLDPATTVGDSQVVRFSYFNSALVFNANSKKEIRGYWINYNKGDNYRIPFFASKTNSPRFSCESSDQPINIDGRWQVEFEPNTPSSYPAVGVFKQNDGSQLVTGTFLTETGDYRFLEGNSSKDSLFLSCFDGSHAFLFKANYTHDTLYGTFNSGNHWKSEWTGYKNEHASLKSPEELTYLKPENSVAFNLKQLTGEDYRFPNKETEGKVVIIQIMGTWCPNCLDETRYFKELYEKYHDEGLEIISIAYETGATFDDYVKNVMRLKSKLNLDFTFLIGGKASKSLASEQFKMLNEVISFPTSIFIDKNGVVKRVHTGFNGPGTGSYYEEYKKQTERLIESMLN